MGRDPWKVLSRLHSLTLEGSSRLPSFGRIFNSDKNKILLWWDWRGVFLTHLGMARIPHLNNAESAEFLADTRLPFYLARTLR